MANVLRWLQGKYREEERKCRGPVEAAVSIDTAECRLVLIDDLIRICNPETSLSEAQFAALLRDICAIAGTKFHLGVGEWRNPDRNSRIQDLAREYGIAL